MNKKMNCLTLLSLAACLILGTTKLSASTSADSTKTVSFKLLPMTDKAQTITIENVSFVMIPVEGGAPDPDFPNVKLDSYYMAETEVTQLLWEKVMKENPSFFKHPSSPVDNISWGDVHFFISKLDSITGLKFRLPSELEWEFAAKGGLKSKGTKYSGSKKTETVAWMSYNSDDRTHPVKSKQPNELGIYDMTGNVMEWCQDPFIEIAAEKKKSSSSDIGGGLTVGYVSPDAHSNKSQLNVLKGGCWKSRPKQCRISYRKGLDYGDNKIGFRLCISTKK